MESTLQKVARVAAKPHPKTNTIVDWIVTALFCLRGSAPAAGGGGAHHLGFPVYFRVCSRPHSAQHRGARPCRRLLQALPVDANLELAAVI
ncbi:MAG TPA: hypothetical protein VIX19_16305 [Terriglobales bacterium]